MGLKEKPRLQEPPHYLETPVRFSFSKCDVNNYCITTLQRDELRKFYARLGYLEQHTWKMLRQMPREKGFSDDKQNSQAYSLLQPKMADCHTFGHFRVEGLTRFFVGLREGLAYVLLVDREGSIQH